MLTFPSHRIDIPNASGYYPQVIWHLMRYKFVKGFVKPTDNIIDIASGTGYGSRMLSDYCKNITGVDIDKTTVEYAKSVYGGENRHFIQGNILELQDIEKYDIAVCFETIEHINKEQGITALKNLKKCLKPDGILFISTPKKLPKEELSPNRIESHEYEYDLDSFLELLHSCFDRPIIFSQTDEIITIGNLRAVWTYIGVCWNGR